MKIIVNIRTLSFEVISPTLILTRLSLASSHKVPKDELTDAFKSSLVTVESERFNFAIEVCGMYDSVALMIYLNVDDFEAK